MWKQKKISKKKKKKIREIKVKSLNLVIDVAPLSASGSCDREIIEIKS